MRPRALAHLAATVGSVAVGAVLATPSQAATGLSLSIPAPAAMTLLPSSTATSTTTATIGVTLGTWTMTIADANTGTGAGRLRRPGAGTYLTDPLQWRRSGGTYAPLTGSPAVVATGAIATLVGLDFRQTTVAADPLSLGDVWQLTANVVVS